MTLYKFSPSQLQLSEVGQFIIRFFADTTSLKIDLEKDPDLLKAYKKLEKQSSEYDVAMKQIRGMAETLRLAELDLLRDHKITTLRRTILSFEYSENKEHQNAFAAAKIIMKNYALLEDENYEKETYDVQRLLEEWAKPENASHVASLKLSEHLKHLQQAATDFDDVFNNRSSTTAQKITYDSKALKRQMLANYYIIVRYVEGCVPIKEDNAFYLSLMDAINNGRRYFSDVLARREGLGGTTPATDVPK